MVKPTLSQLDLFSSTSLGWGFAIDTAAAPAFDEAAAADAADTFEAAIPEAASAPRVAAHSFRLAGDRPLASGWKSRAVDTIAAIRLMQRIDSEDRHATPDEQAKLALFTGFGASDLANNFFRRAGEGFRPGWEDLGNELERLVSDQEMAALARATQYAHFTPEFMVRAIWRALDRMGFAGGRVLEPGCGSGLFLALMPETIAKAATITAVEMDPTTARIATLLYPEAWVRNEDFTKAKLGETFDLAIGNPPFSDRTVRADDPAGKLGLSLHEYFIARSIERLKPGGLAAFVCSRYLMDRVDPKAREHIAGMADLVGAIRMPEGAMMAASGTDVVVDLLFFQKRQPGATSGGPVWHNLQEVVPDDGSDGGEGVMRVNHYFAEHGPMVLGHHAWTSSAYGPAYTCEPVAGMTQAVLDGLLDRAIAALPPGICEATDRASDDRRDPEARRIEVGTAAEGATVKEGSYVLLDDRLMQVIDGAAVPVAVKSGKGTEGTRADRARPGLPPGARARPV